MCDYVCVFCPVREREREREKDQLCYGVYQLLCLDMADCSIDDSFNQSFSGSSIEEETPCAVNFFLTICTADGK